LTNGQAALDKLSEEMNKTAATNNTSVVGIAAAAVLTDNKAADV
jgi:hypothetical protein